MPKKINKPETSSPDDGGKSEVLQLHEKTLLETKFDELTFDKKKEYLRIVFGTVRGCTGFFDTRFTAGMSDYKTFDIGNGEFADVIIRESGTYTEGGGGSESDNSILLLFKAKLYSGGGVRYFETRKIDRTDLNYQEIIDCTFDESKDEFTITVKCADNSSKNVLVKGGSKYDFEEDLISKFWIPKELLGNQEEIKKLLQEEISKEERELATQNMYQRAVDIFILKDNRVEAVKYINTHGIKLSNDQRKSYVEYLLDGWKQGYGRSMRMEDMKTLLNELKNFSDPDYIRGICELMIEKSASWEGEESEDLIQSTIDLGLLDANTQYTKILENKIQCILGWGDNKFESLDVLIKKYNQDEKVWYQKILEQVYEKKLIINYKEEYVQKVVGILAQKLGRSEDEIFKDIFLKDIENYVNISASSLKKIFNTIVSKGYDKTLYIKIFDKVCENKTIRKDKSRNDTLEIIKIIFQIKEQVNKKFPQEFFIDILQIYANKEVKLPYHDTRNKYITDYSPQEKDEILDELSNKYLTSYINFTIDDLVVRGLKDENKILSIVEHAFGEKHNFEKTKSFIGSLKRKDILNIKLEEKINELLIKISSEYCKGKEISCSYQFDSLEEYCRYAPKDLVEEYVNKKIKEYLGYSDNRDRDCYFSHMANCLINAGFDQQYFQDKIMSHIDSGEYRLASKRIKGFGLHIDKVRVNTLIEKLFQEGKVEDAEIISIAGGLYDLRKNKILSRKLENKKLGSRDAKRGIEALKLDKSYYKYVIDIHINEGELKDALELAEKNDLLISQEQFDRYLGRNERLRKADEERKLREHQERETLATEMMKYVSEGKISCDIDYTQDQKYVLIREKTSGLKIASKNLEWHRDIVSHVHADKKDVVGGGRISIDDQQKIIKIYGRSGDFGKVESEYNVILQTIIKVQYPDYEITIE